MKPKRQQQDRAFVKREKREIRYRSIAHEMAGKNIQLKTMRLKRTKQTGCMGVSDDSRLLKNIFQLITAFV